MAEKEMYELKRLRAILRQNPHLRYILFLPAFLICFFTLERLIAPEDVRWWVYSPLDDLIPFWEGFVIPYYFWYPLLFVTGLLLLLKDVPNFKNYMRFLIFGFGGALLFCLIVPNGQLLRPEAFSNDNALSRLVGLMYSMDTNTNVFPSMHVIGSVAAAGAAWKSAALKKLRLPWTLLAVAVSLSTVFIKQHSVLDIFGALAFCLPLWILIYGERQSAAR